MKAAPEVRENASASRFEAIVDGRLAHADYQLDGDRIIFTHTLVPPELEGRGVGTALVRAGLESARRRGLRVVPRCSFFARYMERHGIQPEG